MARSSSFGFIYIVSNPGAPGLLKVGFTNRSVQQRVQELGGAGSPYNFEVLAAFRVTSPRFVERQAHKILADKRFNKEWFSCSLIEAAEAVKKAAGSNLLGSCLEHELELAEEEVRRWSRKKREMESDHKTLEQGLYSARNEATRRIEETHQHARKRILSRIRWPRLVQLFVLLPSVGLLLLHSVGEISPGGVVVSLGVLAGFWPWLSSINEAKNMQTSQWKQLNETISHEVYESLGHSQRPLVVRLETAKKRLSLVSAELERSLDLRDKVKKASNATDMPQTAQVQCTSCSRQFLAYRAAFHVCPHCSKLLG